MTRKRAKNRDGFRFCNKCDDEFPLTTEHFPKDANRVHGLGYQCRACEKKYRKPDLRKNRQASMTDEQKERKKDWQQEYAMSDGRASYRVGSYKLTDKKRGHKCDLTTGWFKQNIEDRPCTYCGDKDSVVGCDRIDNSIGHTKANVVPCCRACNTARMDNFTHAEMFLIGAAIKQIKQNRLKESSYEPMAA